MPYPVYMYMYLCHSVVFHSIMLEVMKKLHVISMLFGFNLQMNKTQNQYGEQHILLMLLFD